MITDDVGFSPFYVLKAPTIQRDAVQTNSICISTHRRGVKNNIKSNTLPPAPALLDGRASSASERYKLNSLLAPCNSDSWFIDLRGKTIKPGALHWFVSGGPTRATGCFI